MNMYPNYRSFRAYNLDMFKKELSMLWCLHTVLTYISIVNLKRATQSLFIQKSPAVLLKNNQF